MPRFFIQRSVFTHATTPWQFLYFFRFRTGMDHCDHFHFRTDGLQFGFCCTCCCSPLFCALLPNLHGFLSVAHVLFGRLCVNLACGWIVALIRCEAAFIKPWITSLITSNDHALKQFKRFPVYKSPADLLIDEAFRNCLFKVTVSSSAQRACSSTNRRSWPSLPVFRSPAPVCVRVFRKLRFKLVPAPDLLFRQ